MGGLCLAVDLVRRGSAINKATPSSFELANYFSGSIIFVSLNRFHLKLCIYSANQCSALLKHPITDTRIFGFRTLFVHPPRSRYPPWILKRGGLEKSGGRLISSNGKIKRIALLFCFFLDKKNLKIYIFNKSDFFLDFWRFFWQFYIIFRFLWILCDFWDFFFIFLILLFF